MGNISDQWILQPLPPRVLLSVTAPVNTFFALNPAADATPVPAETVPVADPAVADTGEAQVIAQVPVAEPVLLLADAVPVNVATDPQPVVLDEAGTVAVTADQPAAAPPGEMGIMLLATPAEQTQADPAAGDLTVTDQPATDPAADAVLLDASAQGTEVMYTMSPMMAGGPIRFGAVEKSVPQVTTAKPAQAAQPQVVPGLAPAANPAQDVAKPANVWQDSTKHDDALLEPQADGFDLGAGR